ncbi:MAG: hypothetical protein AAGE52_38130, partial [Myxococcota bacterium]
RSLAERAATMQQEDPSKHAAAIGTLLGYPRCCIDAFLSQADRSNNSFNRYATAQRTDAETWPWELADLRTKIYPFYPCRYDCPAALTYARQTLAQLDASDFEATRQRLARPVLYFDDEHQLVFEGSGTTREVRFRDVLGTSPLTCTLGGLLAEAKRLEWTFDHLRAGWSIRRIDPALGFVAPFG